MPKRPPKDSAGFSRDQITRMRGAQERAERGGAPRIVVDALFPQRLMAGEIELDQPNVDHLIALQMAAPSILEQEESARFDVREIAAALFILTHDQNDTERLLGIRALDPLTGKIIYPQFAAAVRAFARSLPMSSLHRVAEAINQALNAAMRPAVPHGVSKSSTPDTPFPPPPAAETPGTAGS